MTKLSFRITSLQTMTNRKKGTGQKPKKPFNWPANQKLNVSKRFWGPHVKKMQIKKSNRMVRGVLSSMALKEKESLPSVNLK
ncbi:hypothetical protein FRX31_031278 [Thalictrum thalictroides]|uniref:Uncharacterized protein n=1 Tax=Thalictrum thalictroides TaxID=46969 RepID=A0A7J6V2E1_THATH|nr:hypothetical protein FRX31_031278 [Thalictrum thalictroides]